ncbi:hemerythrin HHE cation binding domain-containing protein [Daldinia caldariorum]|uniref:hemerythrin HHE cation binding domain-containing protein n=1 Tax=Daldinia caldariorum TaxID=326644 RepID=UPI002007EF6E|nr:hemerythrin HHE cation binding domain-containing protein [Daldinia caldariorum]KAI1466877.1 hemerythrin HHE cation binding domain-containing protein [Daldinia caldariorum]
MFRQPIRLARFVRPPVRVYAPAPSHVLRRTFAEHHFPGNKAESLEHSQIFKISQAIQQDHSELEEYYRRIINSKDPDEQLRFQNAFIWELARHAIAEELVVYPVLEEAVADGKERADKDRDEHQKVKEQLYEFQKLRPGDPSFSPTLEALYKDLKQHIKEEEEQDLVKLEDALGLTRSKELSQKFEKTKMFTPTRSHPRAPNKPPFETVVGLMTAPIDKIRDLFTKFPDMESTKPYGGKSP